MDAFCGSVFWNRSVTWDTENPDLTECFQQTVLAWVPCGFIWVFAPYETYQILYSKARYIPWSIFNVPKLIINLMLIILSIASLGYSIYESSDGKDIADVYYVTPAVLAVTFALTLGLTLAGRKRGIQSSGALFVFWFLLTVAGIVTYRTRITSIIDGMSEEETFPFVWDMIYFPLVVAMLFLNFFSDKEPQYVEGEVKCDNPSPEGAASFASLMIYHWFNPLAWKGYKRPLEFKDLWDLNPRDKSKQVVPRFDLHWEHSLSKRIEVPEVRAIYGGAENGIDFKPSATKKKMISVLPALVKTFGPTFCAGAILKAIQDCLSFVSPQILSLLITFVKDSSEEVWKGYVYAAILTITAITQTIFLSQYFQRMFIVGLQIRTSIVATIYRKAIRISNGARKDSTVGEIVNLMAVDAQRFMDLTTYLNMIWSAPLQIGLSVYFLYNVLGVAVFAGLGVMILLIPINGFLANATKKLQIKQMKNKDRRVKMMNEILSGMKVLKLYAWEPSFQANVENIRKKEIDVLKRAAYLSAGTAFIWTCAPFLVSLTSFMTFVLESSDNVLTPDIAFVSLTLFNIMRMPMTILPLLIVQFVQADVSLKRLNKFLNADELDPSNVSHEKSGSPISIEKASFAWAKGDEPVLKDINMEVKTGKLVAVVGQVGAGKTSLISALLGEMEKATGQVNTHGRIAYIPQQAWIQNCTLRDNILFGKSYEADRYSKIVGACAMKPDLAMLPGGDSTEIGEKGINLSGGQKQRISLARAVYADLDVYLFDDPLSAVDSHVGKQIFDEVIGPQGLLKKKTRLLVTHGITFLPQVDQIIVIKDGEITETGSYNELLTQKGAFAEFLLSHLDEADDEADDVLVDTIKQQLENSMGKDEFQRKLNRQRSQMSESGSQGGDGTRSLSRSSSVTSLERSGSLRRRSSAKENVKSTEPAAPQPDKNKLIEVEKAETGKVKGDVYVHYLRSIGFTLSFLTLFLYIIYQGCSMYSNIWLSQWSAANITSTSERDMYLGVYGALGAGQGNLNHFIFIH